MWLTSPLDDSCDLIFTSTDNVRCEVFIRSIVLHGVQTGRAQDKLYLANYAMAHLDGMAIHFVDGLDEDTTQSWPLLKKALLNQFGAPPPQEVGSGYQHIESTALPEGAIDTNANEHRLEHDGISLTEQDPQSECVVAEVYSESKEVGRSSVSLVPKYWPHGDSHYRPP